MCRDALDREESCGGHFREEHQTADGEAKRDDERFSYSRGWEYAGDGVLPCSIASRSCSRLHSPTELHSDDDAAQAPRLAPLLARPRQDAS